MKRERAPCTEKNQNQPCSKKAYNHSSTNASKQLSNTLMWFRTDLRINDNPALTAATQHRSCPSSLDTSSTYAVYILSPKEFLSHDLSPVKVDLILRHLITLRQELYRRLQIPLIVLTANDPEHDFSLLETICQENDVGTVYCNAEYEVDESKRDKLAEARLACLEIPLQIFHDQCIVAPGKCFTQQGNPYTVFTPFKKCWYSYLDINPFVLTLSTLPLPNANVSLTMETLEKEYPIPSELPEFPLPSEEYAERTRALYPPSEDYAHKKLLQFVSTKLEKYKEHRDAPGLQGTSGLSPYLALGIISARTCFVTAVMGAAPDKTQNTGSNPDLIRKQVEKVQKKEGVECWLSELCWRDFYRHVLFHFPRVCMYQPFKKEAKNVSWNSSEALFQSWCQGRTGYPLVDAGMRQLNKTGWMHNRVRMVTAMFLTKHLLIDWRKGERYFMQHLVDGDFASNNGGWQWSASTGTDAQPYFRVFNPRLQSERFDPEGDYILTWIPELMPLKGKGKGKQSPIHRPIETLGLSRLKKMGYVEEVVQHETARKKAIEAFKVAYSKDKELLK